jgi:hypothetical protein
MITGPAGDRYNHRQGNHRQGGPQVPAPAGFKDGRLWFFNVANDLAASPD